MQTIEYLMNYTSPKMDSALVSFMPCWRWAASACSPGLVRQNSLCEFLSWATRTWAFSRDVAVGCASSLCPPNFVTHLLDSYWCLLNIMKAEGFMDIDPRKLCCLIEEIGYLLHIFRTTVREGPALSPGCILSLQGNFISGPEGLGS